jgi:small subunit ribosomal protein S2
MRRLPNILFVVDGKRDLIAIKEARKLKIPVVGICDSNSDPDLYDLLVPANDDAMKSLHYLLQLVKETIGSVTPQRPSTDEAQKPKAAPVAAPQRPANTEAKPQRSHLDHPLQKSGEAAAA